LENENICTYGHENNMIPTPNGDFCSQSNIHLGKLLSLSVLRLLAMRAVACLHHLHVSQDKQQDCWEINGKEGRLKQFGEVSDR